MNRKSLSGFLVATLLGLLLPSLASAMGESCVGQSGAAYGLCNAYCDAMDCDGDAPNASETACLKVADKYLQITGSSVPCGCPLVSDDYPIFKEMVSPNSSITITSCTYNWAAPNDDSLIACSDEYSSCTPRTDNIWGAVWPGLGTLMGDDSYPSPDGTFIFDDAEAYESCKALLEEAIPSTVTCDVM